MKNAKILILDDEPNILLTLGRALELADYRVIKASTVAEAEAALATGEPELGVFDVKLPDGDGIELLNRARQAHPELPIIMMSGHGSIDDAVRATHLGAVDFFEKPVGQERLLVTVANALELTRLKEENRALRDEVKSTGSDATMLGRSRNMQALKEQIERVAESEGRVLITGENGTGKELVARQIHQQSTRKDEAFVSLNCAAVPAELIESELFGHEKGAFTGAINRKKGKFERAHGGTLFLDEVGDMPAAMQAKLLRVLQTNEFEPVGGNRSITVDVRVVAATNKDLAEEIAAGRFREDLYYRLNVVPLHSPPLRERKEDIPVLVEHFLDEAATRNHRKIPKLSREALGLFAAHDYPGNVRELRNLVERIVILTPRGLSQLEASHVSAWLPSSKRASAVSYRPGVKLSELVQEAERSIVGEALSAHDGAIAETARALGVERSNFHKKLKALGLK